MPASGTDCRYIKPFLCLMPKGGLDEKRSEKTLPAEDKKVVPCKMTDFTVTFILIRVSKWLNWELWRNLKLNTHEL